MSRGGNGRREAQTTCARDDPFPDSGIANEGANLSSVNYRDIITLEPGKRGGRPCVCGLRITVGDVLGWIAADMSWAEIIEDFPDLTEQDIRACLAYAADRERHSVMAIGPHAPAV